MRFETHPPERSPLPREKTPVGFSSLSPPLHQGDIMLPPGPMDVLVRSTFPAGVFTITHLGSTPFNRSSGAHQAPNGKRVEGTEGRRDRRGTAGFTNYSNGTGNSIHVSFPQPTVAIAVRVHIRIHLRANVCDSSPISSILSLLFPRPHLYRSLTGHPTVRDIAPEWSRNGSGERGLVQLGTNVDAVMVVLMTRGAPHADAHYAPSISQDAAPCELERCKGIGMDNGHQRRRGSTPICARTGYGVYAARARDAVPVVLHRRDEVKQWAFLRNVGVVSWPSWLRCP